MKKIISLFARNYDTDHRVRDEIVSGAEWVAYGAGIATRKMDGMCCLLRDGRLYKRHEVKPGKTPPAGFEVADADPITGKQVGWLLVGDGPEDQYFRKALATAGRVPCDGTYELLGPKVQGNPERYDEYTLVRHGQHALDNVPRDFAGLTTFFSAGAGRAIEGIVWHHPDGRMVKIKAKDFGVRRSTPDAEAAA